MSKSKITVANWVTFMRFACMPLIVFFYFSTDFIPSGKLIAMILFLVAALTDFVDGWIARRFNQVTDLGKLLDPIADKLLTFLGFVLIFTDVMLLGMLFPIWFAVVVFFLATLRDYITNILRQLAALKGKVMAADWYAKIKSTVQYVAIALAMFYAYYCVNCCGGVACGTTAEAVIRWITVSLLGISALLSIASGISYIMTYAKIAKSNPTPPQTAK